VCPQVERYLRALVDEARAVLAEEFVGAYAGGSVALDAYQPGRSDIDVALLCRSSLPDAAKGRLVQRLRNEALECPARGLELVVYRQDVASSATADPGFELELDTGADIEFRVTLRPEDRPAEDGLFWYGLDRSILHQSGRVLAGPGAAAAFAEPGPGDLRDLLATSLRWWIARTSPERRPTKGAEDVVLGACRALVRVRSGRWLSKVDAGRQLLQDGDVPTELLAQSIAARAGGPFPSGAPARQFQRQVLRQITGEPVGLPVVRRRS
jgi:hypothetical protein